MISGGYSSSDGRGYYFSEVKFQAEWHARDNGKVTAYGLDKAANILDYNDAIKIGTQLNNFVVQNNPMDRNVDIIGILSGHDIIKKGATINVMNGGVIEWLKDTK